MIGAKGDGPRVVDAALHEKICARHNTQKTKVRDLRRQLAELEASWDEMRGGVGGALDAVAARLGPDERRRARRVLARALHPDLFAQDAAAYTLATELLKTLKRLFREEGLSGIIVEQHPQKILALTDNAVILERGAIVHSSTSAALANDPATLERYLGVGAR